MFHRLPVQVRMARYNTRIRGEAPVVEVTGRNGSNAQARVKKVNGKRLTLGARGDEVGFQAVLSEGVQQIRFRNSRLTQERMAQCALLTKVRAGSHAGSAGKMWEGRERLCHFHENPDQGVGFGMRNSAASAAPPLQWV